MSFFNKLKSGLSKSKEGFTGRIESLLASFGKVDEELFEELEEILIMSDISIETTMQLLDGVREEVKNQGITDANMIKDILKDEICDILSKNQAEITFDNTPSVILIVGVNGVGKTTSIGKISNYYKEQGKKVILCAGDTFRAAATEQLDIWSKRVGVDIVKHQEGADPGAVIFDGIQSAKSKNADLLVCDTAGRLHTKVNLMNELTKLKKIIDKELPDSDKKTLLVLDATTGQNGLNQAKLFSEAADVDGIILTKLDGTAKGGIIISIANEMSIPIYFIGVGEQMDDLQVFDAKEFTDALFE